MKTAKLLLLAGATVSCVALVLSSCESTTEPVDTPPVLPAATADQVGLPTNYATTFRPFYVFDRADTRQVRVVYGNAVADSGAPYRYGSVLVMETYRAKVDAQNAPTRDANGRFERDVLLGIFVMRKEKWFGRRYKENQTGDWEYASFNADQTPAVVGDAAALACASCHVDASQSRDWVYRGNIRFAGASGALPAPPAGQAANEPFIDNYTFVPGTITVRAGTRITWTNRDQVKHTITTTNTSFSALLVPGASVAVTVNTVGTLNYLCAIHPQMRGSIVVQP